MSMKDLVVALRETFLRPAETASVTRLLTQLDEVLAAIEALQLAERGTPAQALARVDWRAALFPLELFTGLLRGTPGALQSSVSRIETDLRACLQEVGKSASGGDTAAVLAARESLVRLRARLQTLSPQLQRGSWVTRWLNTAALSSALVGAVAAAYLRSDLGMQLVRVEALAPAAAYQSVSHSDGELVPQAAYVDDFMREFSKAYFGHPNQFDSLYYDKPKEGKPTQRRTLQHKISLRNASHGLVRYVSSIEAIVEARGEARFPWERLTVTPHVIGVIAVIANDRLTLVSDGIGPALDVRAQWRLQSGLVIARDQIDIFHRQTRPAMAVVEVGEREVRGGTISEPLYIKLEKAPTAPTDERYLQVGPGTPRGGQGKGCTAPSQERYGWYEILATPAQLRRATTVGYDEPYALDLRYRALNHKDDIVSATQGRLSRDRVYYRHAPHLIEDDPRCGGSTDSDNIIDAVDGPPIEMLAAMFADEKVIAQPKGVDLLTARLGVDLFQVASGRRVAATAELDGFLNPQGILVTYLSLNMPDRLNYQVSLRVNGQSVTTYRFAALVPDFNDFHSEGEANAVARLRKVFGVAQP